MTLTVDWTENSSTMYTGSVASADWFRVDFVFGNWYLTSALPVPLDLASGVFGSLALAQDAASDILDAFNILVPPNPDLTLQTMPITVPALLLNGTADVAVTWAAPMPSATYDIDMALLATALVGKVTASVLSQSASGATVRLTATATIALPGTALLVANALA